MIKISVLSCALLCVCLTLTGCIKHTSKPYDLVIEGGRVIDPETGLDAIRQVGINGSRIDAVSTGKLVGKQYVDATGLVVSPGFIDLHDHAQNISGQIYHARDGVTTGF